jgi:hypothetical protein
VVCVTGFQLYKDANEFYFAFECVAAPPARRAARSTPCAFSALCRGAAR